MNSEEYYEEFKEFEENFLKQHNHVSKHIINGFTRIFILWIVSKKGPIHGYGIMKELDIFFKNTIKRGIVKKASSSKIYPILKKMENNDIILGKWETQNNKKVKIYTITDKGEKLLDYVKKIWLNSKYNKNWMEFIHDMVEE